MEGMPSIWGGAVTGTMSKVVVIHTIGVSAYSYQKPTTSPLISKDRGIFTLVIMTNVSHQVNHRHLTGPCFSVLLKMKSGYYC